MNKRISVIFIFLAFVLSFGYILNNTFKSSAIAEQEKEDVLVIKSKSAYMIDWNSKTPIYSQMENERLPIASMCKIMTLLLIFENIDNGNLSLETLIPVSENASGMGGSQVFLESNAEYPASELIKSIVVASANDACVAMAEYLYGGEDVFVSQMNQKAKELSMDNTVFVNCTGLPRIGQYSCAKDVAVMFCELLKHSEYFTFSNVWMDDIHHPKDRITSISNTNKLIKFYQGCDSGKTGFTSEAGHCLCASAVRNGMRIVSVVISAPDSKTRFNEVSSMFNYAFANFQNKLVVNNETPLDLIVGVEQGKKDTLQVVAENPVHIFAPKTEKISVEINFEPLNDVIAPVLKGDLVGHLKIYRDGELVSSVNVLSNEDIYKMTYFDFVKKIIEDWAI